MRSRSPRRSIGRGGRSQSKGGGDVRQGLQQDVILRLEQAVLALGKYSMFCST